MPPGSRLKRLKNRWAKRLTTLKFWVTIMAIEFMPLACIVAWAIVWAPID